MTSSVSTSEDALRNLCFWHIQNGFASLQSDYNGDLIGGIVCLALSQANFGHLVRPTLREPFVTNLDVTPTLELLRPVNAAAMARSLQMPRETMRRVLFGLVDQGHVLQLDKGFVIHPNAMSAQRIAAPVRLAVQRLLVFLLALIQLSPDSRLLRITPDYPEDLPATLPEPLLATYSIEFCLRLLESVRDQLRLDVVDAVLWVEVELNGALGSMSTALDASVQRLSTHAILQSGAGREHSILLARETRRRRLIKLHNEGWIARRDGQYCPSDSARVVAARQVWTQSFQASVHRLVALIRPIFVPPAA
jgi:hypothetical protein